MATDKQLTADSPREDYPVPIGVLTSTLLGYRADDPWQLILVELQKPEVSGKGIVLPGGIFNIGRGKHRSQRTVANDEILEETGLHVVEGESPQHIAISQRMDVDPRRWCSFPTINGANDYIMAAPVEGEVRPRDVDEVRSAFYQDVREIDRTKVGRGHDLLLDLWQVICENDGLSRTLFEGESRDEIEALSNGRHLVTVGELNNMIYLEDREPVFDSRT